MRTHGSKSCKSENIMNEFETLCSKMLPTLRSLLQIKEVELMLQTNNLMRAEKHQSTTKQ